MTEAEKLTYIAGLLEGEGYFGTITNWVSGKGYRYPRLGITMTDRDVIERAAEILCTNVYSYKAQGTGAKLPQFRAVVTGKKAAAWMERLLPYMGTRRAAQINKTLDEWRKKPSANAARSESMKAVAAKRTRNAKGAFIKD